MYLAREKKHTDYEKKSLHLQGLFCIISNAVT